MPFPFETRHQLRDATARSRLKAQERARWWLSYSDGMSQLRLWLDHRKIKPAGFKITGEDRIGFEISFSTERDASEFEAFQWVPLPS